MHSLTCSFRLFVLLLCIAVQCGYVSATAVDAAVDGVRQSGPTTNGSSAVDGARWRRFVTHELRTIRSLLGPHSIPYSVWSRRVIDGLSETEAWARGALGSLTEKHGGPLGDVAEKMGGRPFGDAAEQTMVFGDECGANETLEEDTADAAATDCALLQREYGMCQAFSRRGKTVHINNTFHDLPAIAKPYAQGYITAKGLEDPVAALAAMVDEHRRIERGEALRWPIAGVHATVEGDGDEVPFATDDASSSSSAPQHHHFRARPFVMDVVYTEVDFAEPSFQADRAEYLKQRRIPAISAPLSSAPAPTLRHQMRADARQRLLQRAKAVTILPSLWRALGEGPYGDLLVPNALGADADVRLVNGTRDRAMKAVLDGAPLKQRKEMGHVNMSTNDANRFRNFNELRYSLRAIYRYVIRPMEAHTEGTTNNRNSRPSFGKIYIIVSHKAQAPSWMRAHDRIVLVEHATLFPNPSRALPTFNSRAIESVIHRIPGLSRHYVYLNNDFMIARPVSFFDYFQPYVVGSGAGGRVIFLPIIRSNALLNDTHTDHGSMGSSGIFLAPKEVNLIRLLSGVVRGPTDEDTTLLGFAMGFSHIPQLMDKLQVMRMVTEPLLRPALCHTRGSRERLETNIPPIYAYLHFSVLWRYGWGPASRQRVVRAMADSGRSAFDLGNQSRISLRGYFLLSAKERSSVEDRSTGAPSIAADVRVLNAANKSAVATWIEALAAPIRVHSPAGDKAVLFAMAEDAQGLADHLATVQTRKQSNALLFLTVNDDLPVGVTTRSKGVFGSLPQLVASEACGWGRGVWEHALSSVSININASVIGGRIAIAPTGPLAALGDDLRTLLELHVGRALKDLARREMWQGLLPIAITGDAHLRPDEGSSTTEPILPSREAIVLRGKVAGRIEAACVLARIETVLGLRDSKVGSGETTTGCNATEQHNGGVDVSFLDALRPESPLLENLIASLESDELQVIRRKNQTLRGNAAVAIASSALRGMPSSSAISPFRHNCSRLPPLPASEVSPSADVYGADLLLDIMRTAVGDCDTEAVAPIPPWESPGC